MDAAFMDWGARYFGSPGFRPQSTEYPGITVGVAMVEALSIHIQVDFCLSGS